MANPTLKRNDGFESQSPHLREAVERLQRQLMRYGYILEPDGLFGEDTEQAIRSLQNENHLEVTGIAGAEVWRILDPSKKTAPSASERLNNFRGDLGWIHAREGHAGRAYWPGGASGVTLDPGVDLGHAKTSMVEEAYEGILLQDQFEAVRKVFGVKGEAAKKVLDADPLLQSIRISRAQAEMVLPYVILPYWEAVSRRFPVLLAGDTPGAVQTALLSLAYNRGAGNRGLGSLEYPLKEKDWGRVADLIGNMQQDHRLEGIRKRRRMEADLIRQELS
ncbi:MAG: peptidoglycan-binding protein [Deltaproteobacteria bacterium]|nr:peptidoglycan-binding protein [Deltaproteobacteria bacterium]